MRKEIILPSTDDFIRQDLADMKKRLTDPDEIAKAKRENSRKERFKEKISDTGI